MIAAGEPLEFVPYGSEYLTHHPGNARLRSYDGSAGDRVSTAPTNAADLSEALQGVSLRINRRSDDSFQPKTSSFWKLRESSSMDDDSDGEEELYASADTVVWSKSNGGDVRTVLRTFNISGKIQDALWCDFMVTDYKARHLVGSPSASEPETRVPCVCLFEASSGTLHCFSRSGEDYTRSVPFIVSRLWPTRYGLLIERRSREVAQAGAPHLLAAPSEHSAADALLFSLLHPLDEVAPVVTRTAVRGHIPKFGYMQYDSGAEVVYVCEEPSLLVMFHRDQAAHTVWQVRRTTEEEDQFVDTSAVVYGIDRTPTCFRAAAGSASTSATASSFGSPRLSHSTPATGRSPLDRASNSGHHSVHHSGHHSGHHSQSPLAHMAYLSRSQSPLPSGMPLFTPSHENTFNTNLTYDQRDAQTLPVVPDICLDQLWCEPQPSGERASKAFVIRDMVGNAYLCYHLSFRKTLKLVSFNKSSARPVLTECDSISALDVQYLPSLKMLLVLDLNHSLTLYAGPSRLCKVHVPSFVFAPPRELECSLPRAVPLVPRRSSLSGGGGGSALPDIGVSPVSANVGHMHTGAEDSRLLPLPHHVSLQDAVRNRVTLESSSGTYYRLSLPAMSKDRIVKRCLKALSVVLPQELGVQVLTKWYMSRNAPGPTDLTASTEMHSFLLFILGTVGCVAASSGLQQVGGMDLDVVTPVALKKSKSSEGGSNADWEYLLQRSGGPLKLASRSAPKPGPKMPLFVPSCDTLASNVAPLQEHAYSVLTALHLVYEDAKLDVLEWPSLPRFAEFLYRLSVHLRLKSYQDLYRKDFPEKIRIDDVPSSTSIPEGEPKTPSWFTLSPPNIFSWIANTMAHPDDKSRFLYIPGTTKSLKAVVLLYAVLSRPLECSFSSNLLQDISAASLGKHESHRFSFSKESGVGEKIVSLLVKLGIDLDQLSRWPSGVVAPLQDAMVECQDSPALGWGPAAYHLVGREDLAELTAQKQRKCLAKIAVPSVHEMTKQGSGFTEKDNGFELLNKEMCKLKFSKDQRISEACRMLQSSMPVCISIQQRPEVSDHEFVEEQERHLYGLCIRTMALPVGRGMMTLRSCQPVLADPLPVPKLCLTGRVPLRNATVDMSHIEVPPNMNTWPLFHNGVAAGLRVAPDANDVDSSWITFNKPRASTATDATIEHAGFLLGLGLNGHLSALSATAIHDYMVKNHELTSVGLLLGLAASKLGSMDLASTKMMSIHVEALLPPTSTELDVHPLVCVASVMGLGLLYAESGHSQMADILLGEVGRPPGPEMDHCIDRESYALAAGLALGLVMLGKGGSQFYHSNLRMADQLHHYMVGGRVRSTGNQRERFRSPSYQIREGNTVNVHVTSPAATLALGMMFFNSGNNAVAGWMAAPETQYLLDMVRPDFLLLRTLASGLILWSDVCPTKAWIESHIPAVVATYAFQRTSDEVDIDHETMSQAYCNILAGACLCVGLKFAGSANAQAFDILHHYTMYFLDLQKQAVAEQAGRNTLETCLLVTVLSLSLVMAGTGDLEVMRICRHLRLRSTHASSHVLYGSYLVTHMALGFLFLGGTELTLSTRPMAVAALLCSLFPCFPIHSSDNRYHLQAFRHLYVLAVEPRHLLPVDTVTGNVVYSHITVSFRPTNAYSACEYMLKAPCHLPELDLLDSVALNDPRYWPVIFRRGKNWDVLKSVLSSRGRLCVKHKAGCLPYAVDPTGCKTAFEQSAIKDLLRGWSTRPKVSACFSENTVISKFTEFFLRVRASGDSEQALQHAFGTILLECTMRERVDTLSTLFDLFQTARHDFMQSTLPLWQARIVLAYYDYCRGQKRQLIDTSFAVTLRARIAAAVDDVLPKEDLAAAVQTYVKDGATVPAAALPFLVWHDISCPLSNTHQSGSSPTHFLAFCLEHLSPAVGIETILRSLL
ncbi:anaphase-promoting complex subunit 1 [Dermacentor silvarum]|uniref:anaphase-promoting complex subunit 1 n=1 Tax=Dermacentor silvarum TaxID=543639 RepID=UPI002100F6E9|nr:anaphase-promoting complex subunit 1 [Dermacentor silvarum]